MRKKIATIIFIFLLFVTINQEEVVQALGDFDFPSGADQITEPYCIAKYPDLFRIHNVGSQINNDQKIDSAWNQLFAPGQHGADDGKTVYYPVGSNMAYILTVDTSDVRSEGMSYGMMIALQLDKQDEFDRLWRWAKTYMQMPDGYFAWQVDPITNIAIDTNPAPDGEEWIAMALLFAAGRWGNDGEVNYQQEANYLLDTMYEEDFFNPTNHYVRFQPGTNFTDPSYHLPAFYELWGRWAAEDNQFWHDAASASRAYFSIVADPQTGLTPDYSTFEGDPKDIDGHGDFRFDAWRVMMNMAVDYAWYETEVNEQILANRLLDFFHREDIWNSGNYGNQFELDGTLIDSTHSTGLAAMNAVGGLASTTANTKDFINALWDKTIPTGNYRYYDGMLYMFGLLNVSGNFRIYDPTIGVPYNNPNRVEAALIIDSSSSMITGDPSDLRKDAAKIFVDTVADQDQIVVVDFDDEVRVHQCLRPVGYDRSILKNAIDNVDSSGGTNISAGLLIGYDQLDYLSLGTENVSKAAILLTDGVGDYNNEANLYKTRGWRIFTIGLGTKVDEDMLKQIAVETGGKYYALTDPTQLVPIYFDISTETTGSLKLLDQIINIFMGEVKKLFVDIGSDQTLTNFFVTWQGSTVDTILINPDGKLITPAIANQDPNIYHVKGATYEFYRVTNPKSGKWTIEMTGVDIPSGGEEVTVNVTARESSAVMNAVYLPLTLLGSSTSPQQPISTYTPTPTNTPSTPASTPTPTTTPTRTSPPGNWWTEVVDDTGKEFVDTSIDLDADDLPHIVYMDNTDKDLEYAHFNGSYWQVETVHSVGDTGHDPNIVVDSNGHPHVAWRYYSAQNVMYGYHDGTSWSIETVHAGVWPKNMSLALDSADNPHISYWTDGRDDLTHAWYDGSVWNIEVVKETSHHFMWTSLAIDSFDRPHIAYSFDGDKTLYYAWYDGSWHFESVFSDGQNIGPVSLALDSLNRPHILHQDRNQGVLYYFLNDGGSWYQENVGSSAYSNISIRIDSTDVPHIGYLDTDGVDYNVMYAYKSGSGWQVETLSPGFSPWLALDSVNVPHVSYLNSEKDLWYARK